MPLTEECPKSLLRVNTRTVFDLEIESLIECNIKNFIITTGYEHEKLEQYAYTNYPDLRMTFVRNKKYDSTNYIYSIWLTRDLIDDDIILLHGDMVFETALLKKLLGHDAKNAVLINKLIKPPEKDFKALVENEMVKEIGINLFGQNAFFCAPVYKFSKSSFLEWLSEITSFINNGNVMCYAEDAFNIISDKIELKPVYYTDEFCMEIDTLEDLSTARTFYG